MSRSCLALLITLAAAAPAAAQPSLAGFIGPGVTSITGDDGATRQLNASFGLEHLAKAERIRLFYDFDSGDYATPGDWRFLSHSAGASYRFTFGKGGAHRFYVGGDGTLRRNGDSWSAADFNGAGAFANLELHPGRATVRTGYRLEARRFPSSPSLDQWQHTAFASVLASFETRTTLIGEVIAGTKHYAAVSASTEVIVVPAGGTTEVHVVGQGQGQGRWGGLANVTLVAAEVAGAPGSNARQVTVFGRIAQSLAAKTGLSFELSRRQVSGEVPPALVATPVSFFDDGVYDDMFASDATRATVSLKSIVAGGIELGGSVMFLDKDYRSTFAFDEVGTAVPDVLRSDRVRQVSVGAVWPLFRSRTGPVWLDLITGYTYTDHSSTSAFYRYTAHAFRFAVGVAY